jgi:hypothetical protein
MTRGISPSSRSIAVPADAWPVGIPPPSTAVPAWLLSALLHAALLIACGLLAPHQPEGAANESRRAGGIVLVARSAGKAEYFAEEDAPGAVAAAASLESSAAASPFAQPRPLVDAPRLPGGAEPDGSQTNPPGGVPSAASLAEARASGGGPSGRFSNLGVETQVFGVKGKGSRFVYVFDRSSSMEGSPLSAAKRELIASLDALQSVHQFQIVFYNQQPLLMPLGGRSAQMVFGDDQGKRQAATFVGGVFADGGTDHMRALAMALQMGPDVIFFLTDADEPQLSSDDFARVARLNRGTSINAIEFGSGPRRPGYSFLERLAAENAGQHTYVDTTRLWR